MLASFSLRRWKSSRDKLAPTGGFAVCIWPRRPPVALIPQPSVGASLLASVSLRRWKSSRDKLAPTGGIRCLYLAPAAPVALIPQPSVGASLLASFSLRRWKSSRDKLAPTGGFDVCIWPRRPPVALIPQPSVGAGGAFKSGIRLRRRHTTNGPARLRRSVYCRRPQSPNPRTDGPAGCPGARSGGRSSARPSVQTWPAS